MDPISTMALVAAFMLPPVPTRFPAWATRSLSGSIDPTRAPESTESLISPAFSMATSEKIASPGMLGHTQSSDKLQWLRAELDVYSDLKDGWDGPGSFGPNQDDIDCAKLVLAKLPGGLPLPKAMIASSGNVGLYWNTDLAFADIEIEGGGSLSLFARRKSGTQDEIFHDDVTVNTLTSMWLLKELVMLTTA